MKTDEDNCWYNGRHELCKELYPGKYEWCSSKYHRCVECLDDGHCPSWKQYCDWDLECEECLQDTHCPEGESCQLTNGRRVCRREDCVDLLEQGFPNYCKDSFPSSPVCDVASRSCVECIDPGDCDDSYVCIDHKCKREEDRDCMDLMEIGITDFCAKNFPSRPVCHTFLRDCVECQFDPQCKDDEICTGAKCIPKEWECEGPEDCLSERFKCVEHKCVKKICSDYDDPDAFCDEYRSDWRCFEGVCVRCIDREDCPGDKKCMDHKCVDKTCDEYKQPDIWCWQKYGDGYKCIDHECVQTLIDTRKCSDFLSTAESDAFCSEQNPDTPHCDRSTHKCVACYLEQHCPAHWECKISPGGNYCNECDVSDDCFYGHKCTPEHTCIKMKCSDWQDPDWFCSDTYGEGYTCEEGECILSDCGGVDSRCPKNYYCPDHDCVLGCRNGDNCAEETPYCSKLTGRCEECLIPEHCGLANKCVGNKCVKGDDCLRDDKNCDLNWFCNIDTCEEGCRDNMNCSEWTPHCSQKTAHCEECVFDIHCEPGYECKGYRCVWVGYECTNDPGCPKNWMCHDQRHECVFGCRDNDNCGKATPYCSQATGRCEECWSSTQCEPWQECNEDYICVARSGMQECKEGDKKSGYRCRDGVWVKMECHGPEECLGHEECEDGLCVDKERECVYNKECPFGYFCNGSGRCQEQRCRTHEECPPGQGCDIAAFGPNDRNNAETSCVSWNGYHCSEKDPCPYPWVCNAFGVCVEKLCDGPEDCPIGFDCIENLCIAVTCETSTNPFFCMEERGWYYRCLKGECVLLSCSAYADPDMMCMDTMGDSYRCEDNRCRDLGVGGSEDPNARCAAIMGVPEAYWDYEKESCVVPNCNEVDDPDALCAGLKDGRYTCRVEGSGWSCRRGRQGEECGGVDECISGLRCKDGTCIKKECERWQDCDRETEWCDHGVCVPLNKTCEGDEECREDFHCDPTGHCVPDSCTSHYACNIGYCCTDSGECIPCEELTCFGNFDCRSGWRCDPKTSKCTRGGCKRGSDCDPGYYCDLDTGECKLIGDEGGCKDDSECPEGQICKGYDVYAESDFLTILKKPTVRRGTCVYPDESVVAIRGVDDDVTCDYCRLMWTKTGREREFPLPPYHEKCRCYGVIEN